MKPNKNATLSNAMVLKNEAYTGKNRQTGSHNSTRNQTRKKNKKQRANSSEAESDSEKEKSEVALPVEADQSRELAQAAPTKKSANLPSLSK